ncbi:helix-turn-helix transcriptional regulator [Tetragenococcus halophilus]|uniref:helix-turn-helix domain-containing protein n=1 Tax=Tetragenococcus halophilus TaxID=51669 RepID=UPI0030C95029
MVEISEERLKELEALENKFGKTDQTKLEEVDTSTIGGRIKYYRIKQGLNQSQVSNRLGMSQSYITNLEHNKKGKNLDTAIKICQTLEVSFKDIYPEEYEAIKKTDSAANETSQ